VGAVLYESIFSQTLQRIRRLQLRALPWPAHPRSRQDKMAQGRPEVDNRLVHCYLPIPVRFRTRGGALMRSR
jgi:hypothetical protein